jgi:glutathione synthase/RimK-type ligase-like ATP-grasp enzyme
MDRVKWVAPRGKRLRHGSISKMEQLRILAEAGIPVPRWTVIEPGTSLSAESWGPYVVVKPTRSSKGAYVRIQRTGRVRYQAPSEYPADHPARRGPMLAQQFIYTGEWPVSAKVLTYFGRAVAAIQYNGRQELPPLPGPDAFAAAAGSSIVASAMGTRLSLCTDPEMPKLAERVHALWPDHPSFGIDIVRDATTGELFVLELNPGGNSWFLTGVPGRAAKEEFGLDLYGQFGALDIIAERSMSVARRWLAAPE